MALFLNFGHSQNSSFPVSSIFAKINTKIRLIFIFLSQSQKRNTFPKMLDSSFNNSLTHWPWTHLAQFVIGGEWPEPVFRASVIQLPATANLGHQHRESGLLFWQDGCQVINFWVRLIVMVFLYSIIILFSSAFHCIWPCQDDCSCWGLDFLIPLYCQQKI